MRIPVYELFLVPTFASLAYAQARLLLDEAALPACALNCQTLIEASKACVPPQAPVTNQATYDTCFCQSALVKSLYQTSDGICDLACPAPGDRQVIQNWYKGKCSGEKPAAPNGVAPAGATPSNQPSEKYVAAPPPSWISKHWQWIVMVVIVSVGLVAVAVVGRWLQRRHERKHPIYRRSAVPGDPAATVEVPRGPKPGSGGGSRPMSQALAAGGVSGLASTVFRSRSGTLNANNHAQTTTTTLAAEEGPDGRASRGSRGSTHLRRLSVLSLSKLKSHPPMSFLGGSNPSYQPAAQSKGSDELPPQSGAVDIPPIPTPPPVTQRTLGHGRGPSQFSIPEEEQGEMVPAAMAPSRSASRDRHGYTFGDEGSGESGSRIHDLPERQRPGMLSGESSATNVVSPSEAGISAGAPLNGSEMGSTSVLSGSTAVAR